MLPEALSSDMSSMSSKSSNPEILSNNDKMPKDTTSMTSSANRILVSGPTATNPFPVITNGNDLTQEQIDELYEEPFSTENALEAVMGYAPQDEKRICKFFNPKTNACFKGANCRLEHTSILKGKMNTHILSFGFNIVYCI